MRKIISIALILGLISLSLYLFAIGLFERNLASSVETSIENLRQTIKERQMAVEEKVSKKISIPEWEGKERLVDEKMVNIFYEYLERSVEMKKLLSESDSMTNELVSENIKLLRHNILTYSFLGENDTILKQLPDNLSYYDHEKADLKSLNTEIGTEMNLKVKWSEGGYAIRDYTHTEESIDQCIDFYKEIGFKRIKAQIDFGLPDAEKINKKVVMLKKEDLVVITFLKIDSNYVLTQMLPDKENIKNVLEALNAEDKINNDKIFKVRH
jgi:hypothetical protein